MEDIITTIPLLKPHNQIEKPIEVKEESLINNSSELKRIEPLRSLFLDCWSNAHDSPDYDKRKWQDLASELRKFGLEVQ